MDYINIEEQSNEIQEIFQNYFEGTFGLYQDPTGTIKYGYLTKDRVRLLIEGQLRKFIEDKLGCKIDFDYLPRDDGYRVNRSDCCESFDGLGEDLLQAYWKVAIEAAKGNFVTIE